jgi:hypothetical protein
VKWSIQKIADEGTSEPYIARLWLGVTQLRDWLLRHKAAGDRDFEVRRLRFDELYQPVRAAMDSTRTDARRVVELIAAHRERVHNREIVGYQAHTVEIHESIAAPLQESFANFVSAAARATKLLQGLLRDLDLEVGFLFSNDTNFQAGLAKVLDPALAGYLAATRAGWSDMLINKRNDLEHNGWRLPDVSYRPGPDGHPVVLEPECAGMPVSAWVQHVLPHVLAFVEDMVAYCVQRGLRPGADIGEVPPVERDPVNPQRFVYTVPSLQSDVRLWHLRYSQRGFPE